MTKSEGRTEKCSGVELMTSSRNSHWKKSQISFLVKQEKNGCLHSLMCHRQKHFHFKRLSFANVCSSKRTGSSQWFTSRIVGLKFCIVCCTRSFRQKQITQKFRYFYFSSRLPDSRLFPLETQTEKESFVSIKTYLIKQVLVWSWKLKSNTLPSGVNVLVRRQRLVRSNADPNRDRSKFMT